MTQKNAKNFNGFALDQSFKRQTHKMVKHNQTIRRLLPTNYLSVFDHFVGLALKELKNISIKTDPNKITDSTLIVDRKSKIKI